MYCRDFDNMFPEGQHIPAPQHAQGKSGSVQVPVQDRVVVKRLSSCRLNGQHVGADGRAKLKRAKHLLDIRAFALQRGTGKFTYIVIVVKTVRRRDGCNNQGRPVGRLLN
jgi:hypothetical protein